jgi:hypothetical protein
VLKQQGYREGSQVLPGDAQERESAIVVLGCFFALLASVCIRLGFSAEVAYGSGEDGIAGPLLDRRAASQVSGALSVC